MYYRSNSQRKAIGVIDNLTVNMKSMSTGGECYKGTYVHTIPEQLVSGANGQTLYLRNMGAMKKYKINYYNIATGQLAYTTSEHQTNVFGRLYVEHPILFPTNNQFMYAFKAYRVNDGSFMTPISPTVIENEIAQSVNVDIELIKLPKNDSSENQVDLLMSNVLKNQLTVTVVSASKYQEIEIYSLDGKLVLVTNLQNNQIILNIEHLSSGIYILKTKDEFNSILTTKFVKL